MTPDRTGVLAYRWTSRGGVQIEGRVHTAHRDRVLAAWWAIQVERTHEADVQVARRKRERKPKVMKLLPKRTGTDG